MRSRRIQIACSDAEYQRFAEVADRLGMTMSATCLKLLNQATVGSGSTAGAR